MDFSFSCMEEFFFLFFFYAAQDVSKRYSTRRSHIKRTRRCHGMERSEATEDGICAKVFSTDAH